MVVELNSEMNLESDIQITSVGSVHEVEPPQPSDVEERLCIGLGKRSVSVTNPMYEMWKETISQEIGSFFNTSDVRIKEIELETNSTHGRTVGPFFVGEVWIDGVPLEFVAGYFSGRTGVIEEESGLDDVRGTLPEAPSWEELGEWWNDEWGTWELEENVTILVHDRGMPLRAKAELNEKIASGVAIEYDSDDNPTASYGEWAAHNECSIEGCADEHTSASELCEYHRDTPPMQWSEDDDSDDSDSSCTESNDMGDRSNMKSKSFNERMNELADDLDEQAREREEERIKQHLRENRETFKAEITDVGIKESPIDKRNFKEVVMVKLDIPTVGHYQMEFDVPGGNGQGERLYEILSYLNADLRHMDMIEGMYLPVAHEDDDWAVQLPSDTDTSQGGWLLPSWRLDLLKSIPRPSISQRSLSETLSTAVVLLFLGSVATFSIGFVLENGMLVIGGTIVTIISFIIMSIFEPN